MSNSESIVKSHISSLKQKYPSQPEFIATVEEHLLSIIPLFENNPTYLSYIPLLLEPNTFLSFKVTWENDRNELVHNIGYRCQFNNSLGPYKGGLRFKENVTPSVIKLLAYEQTFKNALTGLPMGGAKGGSDFDPKGKSEAEVRRFCQKFAIQLNAHGVLFPGGLRDVPAGDMGVGGRELGYIFGALKEVTRTFDARSLTGKPYESGGSLIRPEATGYGLVYLLDLALASRDGSLQEKKVVITGSGNVAVYAAQKFHSLGARVVSLSDSNGVLVKREGFTSEELKVIEEAKFNKRQRLSEISRAIEKSEYFAKQKAWDILKEGEFDVVAPCATQNEIGVLEAQAILKKGGKYLVEGANMPCTNDAIELLNKEMEIYLPAKAANAGGVAVSGLEMAQNGTGVRWNAEKVDGMLKEIMKNIWKMISESSKDYGREGDYQFGANAASFEMVVKAMKQQGMV